MSHQNGKPHVSINEVACYRTERTLIGCANPPSKGIGAPHQCSRVNEKRSGWGELSLASNASAKINRRVAVDDPFRFGGVAVVLRVPAVVRVARAFEQARVVGAGGRDASAIPIYDDVINIAHVSIH